MVAILAGLLLTGCNSLGLFAVSASDDPAELRLAFSRDAPEARVRELRRHLPGASPSAAVDIQTAIVMELARQVPTRVADRRVFHVEAERLARLLANRPRHQIPVDSAILTYLAELADGRGGADNDLSSTMRDRVLALCGPGYALLGPDARVFDESADDRLLRQSCFAWLLGDGAKARGLFYQAKATADSAELGSAGKPFDLFLWRFKQQTGHDLLDHRTRLVGTHHGVTYAQVLGRSPIEYSDNGERTVSNE